MRFIVLSFLVISVYLFSGLRVNGQQYVDTIPSQKNVVLEEFTAVHCSWCPAAHLLMDSLMDENPGRIFGVAMHPANTSYTAPYAGSQDFRRAFADAFFSIPFATDSVKFFPGAFINRREWIPGRRERYTTSWREEVDSMMMETSPLNVGLHVTYNSVLSDYTVIVEVYYTDTVDFPHSLYVYITEDSLVAEQNNGGVNYVHNHIFRESLCAQWGDSIGSYIMPGTLYRDTLYFADDTAAYNWEHCHFLAMVRNASNEEILNVNQCGVQEVLITKVGHTDDIANQIRIYPNPFKDYFYLKSAKNGPSRITYIFRDLSGRQLYIGETMASPLARIDFPKNIKGNVFLLEMMMDGHCQRQVVLRND